MGSSITQKNIVLDIEGTVCPISYVKDVMFPYFLSELPSVLHRSFSSSPPPDLQPYIDDFAPSVRTSFESLYAHIKELTLTDQKVSELKALQGYVFRQGFKSGVLKTPLFPDVYEAFRLWTVQATSPAERKNLYIYSSGSVDAQILFFSHTERGDLTRVIQGYYDTVTAGMKFEPDSYSKIADSIELDGDRSNILFLSDNVREVEAAKEAGLEAFIVDRPGNAKLTDEDKEYHRVVTDFTQLL
ncbi:HAD-like domain-containing protein [Limtongia smithiae]|uniref:HAD-like domain-containing protein n=1 Tax=Limtongia smithiae TaxID=1125753 RepID=UPI0034CF5C6F